jgi:MraZ protein
LLRGNHPAKVDEKGRLKIPADFRAILEEKYGPEVYVTSLDGQSARIYPLREWQAIEDKLGQAPAMDPSKVRFIERTSYYGQVAALDRQGRILIHSTLRESAATDGEVAVLGKLHYLEVWNHEKFLQKLDQDPFTTDDMSRLAGYGI